jgi:8-oxo-dGTP diphosphatase
MSPPSASPPPRPSHRPGEHEGASPAPSFPTAHPFRPEAGKGEAIRPVVPVAVGVLLRADGAVLLGDRPGARAYAGYWEFPGGKIEPGESVEHALARELAEELRITVTESVPWLVFDFDYPHVYVRLYFRRVFDWGGAPTPLEGQRLLFHPRGAPAPDPLLPAARPVMRWLELPDRLSWTATDGAGAKVEPSEHQIDGVRWLASTVRNSEELTLAVALGAEFAVAPRLPERELAELCRATPIPVYAPDPGGPDSLRRLQRLGAHGVAASDGV